MEQSTGHTSPCDNRHSLIGKQFGRLRVIGISDRSRYVICRCECGNNTEIRRDALTRKHLPILSCGCLRKEFATHLGVKHGRENVQTQVDLNLRHNTNFQCIEKTDLFKHNTSGATGVTWDKRTNKWVAQIMVHKRNIFLGRFVHFDDAVKARQIAEDKYHRPLIEAKNEGVVDV